MGIDVMTRTLKHTLGAFVLLALALSGWICLVIVLRYGGRMEPYVARRSYLFAAPVACTWFAGTYLASRRIFQRCSKLEATTYGFMSTVVAVLLVMVVASMSSRYRVFVVGASCLACAFVSGCTPPEERTTCGPDTLGVTTAVEVRVMCRERVPRRASRNGVVSLRRTIDVSHFPVLEAATHSRAVRARMLWNNACDIWLATRPPGDSVLQDTTVPSWR